MILFSMYRTLQIFKTNLRYENSKIFNMFLVNGKFSNTKKSEFKDKLTFFTVYRCMAGHAKWQNIKHIKAAKDREKAHLCNKYVRLVTAAIREKGPDPKSNNRLACLLEEARKNNVPNATIENVLKKPQGKKLKPGTIEIMGPGGCFIVVDFETDNICDFRHSLKMICKKYGCHIVPGDGGKWRSVYEQKGIIRVISFLDGKCLGQEIAVDAAIEAGAEDVQKTENENSSIYEFLCAPGDLLTVKKELEEKFMIEEAYVGYLPFSTVLLDDATLDLANNFLDEIGDLPDVCRIFENIE